MTREKQRQNMCLEHMLCCKIERGALFYGMPRRRMEITFTDELRKEVLEAIAELDISYEGIKSENLMDWLLGE